MEKTKVYDWPTRLFHGSFAGFFLAAFVITKVFDDEDPAFSYHMLLGIGIAAAVVLRIIWGFIGSKYARFSSFALRPSDLLSYFKDVLTGRSRRWLGHNPASSWAALTMMALALGLALTGYLMASGGDKHAIKEFHELLANAFIVVVVAHVSGVILHMLRHRDGIALSMVHGRKSSIDGQPGIARSHLGAGLVYVVLLAGVALNLGRNYDASSQSLNLFGNKLQLGESESNEHSESGEREHHGEGKQGREDRDDD